MKGKTERYFITGTGTGVGKTYVSIRLLKKMKGRPLYLKPVETGTDRDTRTVLKAFGEKCRILSIHHFKTACSPHLAARLEKKKINYRELVAEIKKVLKAEKGSILVEGAGGLFAPINDEKFQIDLIKALGLPVILVATASLGTINHTLLSLEALRRRNIRVAYVIMNDIKGEKKFIAEDNVKMIRKTGTRAKFFPSNSIIT